MRSLRLAIEIAAAVQILATGIAVKAVLVGVVEAANYAVAPRHLTGRMAIPLVVVAAPAAACAFPKRAAA